MSLSSIDAKDVPVFITSQTKTNRVVGLTTLGHKYMTWGDFRPYRRLFTEARMRALKKGLPFDLTQEWLKDRLEACKGRCEQTGMELIAAYGTGNGRGPWSPSLDRIDSRQGYTTDNVQIVCWSYNVAKSNFTDADIMRMAQAMVLHQYKNCVTSDIISDNSEGN